MTDTTLHAPAFTCASCARRIGKDATHAVTWPDLHVLCPDCAATRDLAEVRWLASRERTARLLRTWP
jgi:hypothetical protein